MYSDQMVREDSWRRNHLICFWEDKQIFMRKGLQKVMAWRGEKGKHSGKTKRNSFKERWEVNAFMFWGVNREYLKCEKNKVCTERERAREREQPRKPEKGNKPQKTTLFYLPFKFSLKCLKYVKTHQTGEFAGSLLNMPPVIWPIGLRRDSQMSFKY